MNKLKCSAPIFRVLASLAFATGTLRAAPVTIDEFSVGIPAGTDTTAVYPGSMLGGNLTVVLGTAGDVEYGTSGGVITLTDSTPGGGGTVELYWGGYNGTEDEPDFLLPDVDLTGQGTNNRFEIDVAGVIGSVEIGLGYGSEAHASGFEEFDVDSNGIIQLPFSDAASLLGNGADHAAVEAIVIYINFSNAGDQIQFRSIRAAGDTVLTPPDTVRPTLEFLKRKKLKKPRPRHTIRGLAGDNDVVTRVEAKVPGKRGWRKAKLRPGGRFTFRTPKLSKRNNRIKFRVVDAVGIRSKVYKVRARGRL